MQRVCECCQLAFSKILEIDRRFSSGAARFPEHRTEAEGKELTFPWTPSLFPFGSYLREIVRDQSVFYVFRVHKNLKIKKEEPSQNYVNTVVPLSFNSSNYYCVSREFKILLVFITSFKTNFSYFCFR